MPIIVPPGGFQGFAQQTPATQVLFQRAGRTAGPRSAVSRVRRRRKARTKAKSAPAVRRRARTAKKARMVKGSAAARRHMAKLRRMRKRR